MFGNLDWSWGGFTDKLGGILDNPQQLQENPWFNMGMGLLSSRYDGNINPYQAAMGGLQTANQNKQQSELRKQILEAVQNARGGAVQSDPRAGGQPPAVQDPLQAIAMGQSGKLPGTSIQEMLMMQSLLGNRPGGR